MANNDSGPDGLELHELKLVPTNHQWTELFKQEEVRLNTVSHVIAVEHIGSTALPGIKSKPVVDIAVMVECPPEHPEITSALDSLGYQNQGEYGLPGRIFFTLGNPPRIHLHVVAKGSPLWSDWLAFREYLKQHPEWRSRYEQEKLRIMDVCHGDRRAYTAMKRPFILQVLALARNETEQHEK